MERNKKRDTILSIIVVLILILMVIGVTYAYFAGVLTNNTSPQTISANTITLTYTDCGTNNGNGSEDNHCQLINASLKPGESVEKTFKVQNTGNSTANFTLYFRRLLNTFTNNELVYKIEDVTNPNSPTTVVAANTPVPYKATEDNNVIINTNNSIAYNTTREFKMTITFVNQPTIDQSYNATAEFLIQVGISEYVPPYLTYILKSKANPASNTNYSTSTAAQKAEMYTFEHAATEQTPAQTDYRYIGSSPNNYVKFNCTNPSDTSTCETWRILGVFPVDDGTGAYTDRVKLIRADDIGNIEWNDTNEENEWVGASLALLLNSGDYHTRSNTYASAGLTASAKDMIGTAKWYLGAPLYKYENVYTNNEGISTVSLYEEERSANTCYTYGAEDCTDERNINTTSYSVGLMYPSDYAYTYANGVDTQCYENVGYCDEGTPNVSWLYNGLYEWLISPVLDIYDYAWYIASDGYVFRDWAYGVFNGLAVRPVVYLKANVEFDTSVAGQDGSSSHPYILKAN